MNKLRLLAVTSLMGYSLPVQKRDIVDNRGARCRESAHNRQPRDFFIDAIDQPIGSGLHAEVVRDTNQRPKGRGARRREAARKRQGGEAK